MDPTAWLLAAETDWVQVTKDLGFPIAVALGLFVTFLSMLSMGGFALWRIGCWLAPMVTRLAESHLDTMKAFQSSSEKQAEHQERATVAMEQHATALASLTETTRAIAGTQKDIQREITEQRKLSARVCENMPAAPAPLVAIQTDKVEMQK